eukprot:CAMPEP_0178456180 /NCGR_PEP_ID=MMETSP0689_2-20121128/46325_1 /TAXON_ID=160604 /ORGANISM="Amphidinium massartii, Strain CS-259" /LENGTH=36 /DNA_ID= /DNA_START= /DNA_END= /DNA_ORIENTATION=
MPAEAAVEAPPDIPEMPLRCRVLGIGSAQAALCAHN